MSLYRVSLGFGASLLHGGWLPATDCLIRGQVTDRWPLCCVSPVWRCTVALGTYAWFMCLWVGVAVCLGCNGSCWCVTAWTWVRILFALQLLAVVRGVLPVAGSGCVEVEARGGADAPSHPYPPGGGARKWTLLRLDSRQVPTRSI